MTRMPPGFHLRLAEQGDAPLLLDTMLRCWTGTVAPNSPALTASPASARRSALPRRFLVIARLSLADDAQMHTVNPLTPPPITMRTRFSG